jgi:TrmH family RNA methyltransferase
MISKQQLSFLRSLHQKKFRQMYGKFLVEGDKLVRELLASNYKVDAVYAVKDYQLPPAAKGYLTEVSEEELRKISTHENPNQVVAVAEVKSEILPIAIGTKSEMDNELVIVCEHLSDPGNAGSIIRIADWFGIDKVFFSENSVDIYNPKVVNSAKGSLFRVNCFYADLKKLFEETPALKVYGTFMNGENIYSAELPKSAFILIGNEANGISEDLLPFIHQKIAIPAFGNAESLNAAVAAGIVLSEFKRREK